MTAILECAFLEWTTDQGWGARVTWKCDRCGRRTSIMKTGRGKMSDSLPLAVECKNGHATEVVPYRWAEEHSTK